MNRRFRQPLRHRLARLFFRYEMQVGETIFNLGLMLLILMLLGIVGRMDYEDERRLECAYLDKSYNPKKDICE